MIATCVAVAAGKGGVIKTTLATHLAAHTAERGRRVLLIDADPQGNVMFDLGCPSDGGAGLAATLGHGEPLRACLDVRPRLDVVCGGPELDRLARSFDSPRSWLALDRALAPVGRYDLVVIDTPARELWLRRLVLTAARAMIVPSSPDRASRVGLVDVARSVTEVRSATNPSLDVMAVVVTPLSTRSTRLRARARERLGSLIADPGLVCDTIPRHAPAAAELCRDRGVLATELARHPDAPRCATALARDWRELSDELAGRFEALAVADSLTGGE